MTQYFGDFAEDATVYIPFNTFDSNDPSASVTITNLADADIKVHKDGGLTQIATDGATISIDFDSITGNHVATIDTSAHADYSTGSDYIVRIEGTTVDAATINAWIGTFSIENRFMRGTDSANTVTPPTVSQLNARTLATADYFDPSADAVATVTTLTNKTGFSLAATGLDAITQSATGMIEIAKAVWDRVLTGGTHNITNSAGKRVRQIDAAFEVHSGTAQAGTASTITLDTGANNLSDNIYRGDRCLITAGTGQSEHGVIVSYIASTRVATMSESWVVTPDATSEFILVPASVDVETWQHSTVTGDGDWSALTTATETDIPGLLTDLQGATFDTATDSNEAIRNRGDAEWTTGAGGSSPTVIEIRQEMDSNSTQLAAIVLDTGTTLDGKIDDIQGATFSSATDSLEAIRDRGDSAWTTGAGGSSPTVVEIRQEMDSNSTRLAAIETDTTEIGAAGAGLSNINLPNQTMDIVGNITGNLSGSVGSLTGHTNQTADHTSSLTTIGSNVDAILVDTSEIGTAGIGLTNLGGMSTGMKAEVNTELDDVLSVDTHAEIGTETPAATQSMKKMIQFLYKAWRNKSTETATTYTLFNDDGTTSGQESTVSDDGTTFTVTEKVTG